MASLILGGLLGSAFLDVLSYKTTSVAIQQFGLQFGLTHDLKSLQTALHKCKSVLISVESRPTDEEYLASMLRESRLIDEYYLATLLSELKDAAYNADDLLDDFEYQHLQQKFETQSPIGDFFPFHNIALHFFNLDDDDDDDSTTKIREITSRLDRLSCYVGEVLELIDLAHGVKRLEITEGEGTSTSHVLGFRYQLLPSHLKQCFAYCSIFPKGYSFRKDSLVQMWMAQGFIKTQGNKRIEDIGSEYFDDLLRGSFFQYSPYIGYVMDDIIHDLAQFVSSADCFRIEKDRSRQIPVTVRHSSVCVNDLEVKEVRDLCKFKNLRTLVFVNSCKTELSPVLCELFKELGSLRVLGLQFCSIKELPDTVSNLKHLRYLDLSNSSTKRLPESLWSVYNLQVLNLVQCNLKTVPKSMGNLINLRHLEMDCERLSLIAGIGKLTYLQKLEKFSVFKQDGHKVGELKEMKELRGRLCIDGVESIENKEEAIEAKLNNKKHLDELELRWYDVHECEIDVDVLECLQPHPNLKNLIINGYWGLKSPSWLENQLLSNLKKIHLVHCPNWEVLPPLGQLPFLKDLVFRQMGGVKQVSDQFYSGGGATVKLFPSLEFLWFDGMSEWQEWSGPGVKECQLFPRLEVLLIKDCPKLRSLPSLPLTHLMSLSRLVIKNCKELASLPVEEFRYLVSLKELSVEGCPKLTSEVAAKEEHYDILLPSLLRSLKICLCSDLDRSLPRSLPNLTSLWCLEIKCCPHITSLPGEAVRHLTALENLYITDCKELTLLGGLQALGRLEQLQVQECPKLTVSWDVVGEEDGLSLLENLETDNNSLLTGGLLQRHMPSLHTMFIKNCAWLTRFTDEQEEWLLSLTALEYLFISHCVNLQALPEKGMPIALERLTIQDCPLLEERCRKKEGPDWIKISHVPQVQIGQV